MPVEKKLRHLTEDEKCSIKKAFEFLDTDKDGFLDYYETKAAMRALGFDVKKSQVLAIMRAYDAVDGNKIGYNDFYYISMYVRCSHEERLSEDKRLIFVADKLAKRDPLNEIKFAYKLFSENTPSGKITLIDLQRINKTLGTQLTEDEMRAMIEEFDLNEDGAIDEAEFIQIMNTMD